MVEGSPPHSNYCSQSFVGTNFMGLTFVSVACPQKLIPTKISMCTVDTLVMGSRSSLQVNLAVHYLKPNPVNWDLNLHVVSLSCRVYFILNDIFVGLNNPTNMYIIYYSRCEYFAQLIFVLLQK